MTKEGTVLDGKYEILAEVGRGGMSIVYLARDKRLNKQWAVKEIKNDGKKSAKTLLKGLEREANILKNVDHPVLPRIVDIINQDGTIYVVMDYIEGDTIQDRLKKEGAQPQELVVEWGLQLASALNYLHNMNPPVIYRDMKPSNVMIKPEGGVKLIDFGTAKEYEIENNADTTALGTRGYAAPEQFGDSKGRGIYNTDARTDIYNLGATLYHIVTGKNPCEPPYEIRPIREINPSLSGGLERIILKCTQPNPANRYQNAAELMYALEHYDEIDDIYRKKQKRKLAAFITTSVITVILGATSIWGYVSAENKKSENYDNILKTAGTYEDYYNAIITDPTRTDAYLKLNDMLTSDFVLDKDEANILAKIQVGLDRKNSDGYSQTYDVLSDLKKKNPDGYQEVCYQYGESFLFYYDINVEKDRYANAAKWYKDAVQKYPVAQIYCDISDCLDLISQYGGAKVKQTEKMYDEYANLWKKVTELEKESEQFDSVDSKLQVWNEVDDIINNNISPLLEVTSKDDVIALLDDISDSSTKVDKSVIADDMKKLQDNIESTKQKINTVKEAEKE